MKLEIQIFTGSPSPIYRQVVDQVCRGFDGATGPEDQLPSVRELAERLVINPNTVAKAYAELTREGIAESRQGRGVFITQRRQVYSRAEQQRRLDGAFDVFINEAALLGFGADEIRSAVERRSRAGRGQTADEHDGR